MTLTYDVLFMVYATAEMALPFFASEAIVSELEPPTHFLSLVYCMYRMSPLWCWKYSVNKRYTLLFHDSPASAIPEPLNAPFVE